MIFTPGHYLHPIGALYIENQIRCVREILERHLVSETAECSMADGQVYYHHAGLSSVLYTEDRIK